MLATIRCYLMVFDGGAAWMAGTSPRPGRQRLRSKSEAADQQLTL